MEKRDPYYTVYIHIHTHTHTVGGNVNWCSHFGKQYGDFSKKLKIELPYDAAIPLLGIYPDKIVI